MELILIYTALATLVSLMASVDLLRPVLAKREIPLDAKILHYTTFFIIGILVAPGLLYPCLVPLKGLEFRDALDKALFSQQ